jgi:hypothetical protein
MKWSREGGGKKEKMRQGQRQGQGQEQGQGQGQGQGQEQGQGQGVRDTDTCLIPPARINVSTNTQNNGEMHTHNSHYEP